MNKTKHIKTELWDGWTLRIGMPPPGTDDENLVYWYPVNEDGERQLVGYRVMNKTELTGKTIQDMAREVETDKRLTIKPTVVFWHEVLYCDSDGNFTHSEEVKADE